MGKIRDRIRVSRGVKTLLLSISDFFARFWKPESSSCPPIKLIGRLIQRLCLAQDLKAIIIEILS